MTTTKLEQGAPDSSGDRLPIDVLREVQAPPEPLFRTAATEITVPLHNENDPTAAITRPEAGDASFLNRPRLTKSP